jgi:phosphate transport system permease protein
LSTDRPKIVRLRPRQAERSKLKKRLRDARELGVQGILLAAALSSVLITVGIVGVLFFESFGFFREVSVFEFLFGTRWTPLYQNPSYGILPLVSATLVTTAVALAVALPLGTIIALYLSEFAPPVVRETMKPTLELLSAVPTVVYGFFALQVVSPLLQAIIPDLPLQNMLSAGIVMGIMIIPYVSSLSEDAMRSVPMILREGSYALGGNKLLTAVRVVLPSAVSGIGAAYILGISRAIGETMIVAVASGTEARLTLNPLDRAQTITAYIVSVFDGELVYGSVQFRSIFAAGLVLFVMTLAFNILGYLLRRRFHRAY